MSKYRCGADRGSLVLQSSAAQWKYNVSHKCESPRCFLNSLEAP